MTNIFRNTYSRKNKDTEKKNARFYLNEISGWRPVDYHDPECIKKMLEKGDQLIAEKVQTMKLDEYNMSFLDEYIDDIVDIALKDIEEQRIRHERVLQEIREGQLSLKETYEYAIASIEKELNELESV